MSDENTYLGAVKDRIGDLAHHAYDTVTGMLSKPSAPPKPAYTSSDASTGNDSDFANGVKALTPGARKSAIDKAVDDAS